MPTNYDSYKFLMATGHVDYEYEARRYDPGTEQSDGGKGTYQRWSVEDSHFPPQFQATMTEFGWNRYYSALSETAKQKFIEPCKLRASFSTANDSDQQPVPALLASLHRLASPDAPRYNFPVCRTDSSAEIQQMIANCAQNLQENEAHISNFRAKLDRLIAYSHELTDRARKLTQDLATKQQEETARGLLNH
jgi:hypothetical protein